MKITVQYRDYEVSKDGTIKTEGVDITDIFENRVSHEDIMEAFNKAWHDEEQAVKAEVLR